MAERNHTVIRRHAQQLFTYRAASLESLPPSVKLDIMLRIDLPSLRRLKLASREYYFVAMTYPSQLKKAHEDDIRARQERKPWHHTRIPDHQRSTTTGWLPEFNVAFNQAVCDWQKLDQDPRSSWRMPGRIGFSFTNTEYIAARLYNLTGEFFVRPDISSHLQVLNGNLSRRCKRMEFISGDLELSKMMNLLCPGSSVFTEAAARLETMRAELVPTNEEVGLTFEEIMEQRNEKRDFEFILGLLKSSRHLTRSLLEWLEDAEMIERTEGEWRDRLTI